MNPLPHNSDSGAVTSGDSFYDAIPANKRGYIHAVVGALFALLMSFALYSDSILTMVMAIVLAAADLVLVLIYTKSKWRQALYPLLYLVGTFVASLGVVNEVQATAIIGLALAVLGTQVAAAKTPVIEGAVVK